MTTIIIIVVVALVFFVALCVVTFMVWKHEEEMRTDSLQSIEANLQELGYRMTGDFSCGHRRRFSSGVEDGNNSYDMLKNQNGSVKRSDPFGWTRQGEFQPQEDEAVYDESANETVDNPDLNLEVADNNETTNDADFEYEAVQDADVADEYPLNEEVQERYGDAGNVSSEPYEITSSKPYEDELDGYVESAEIVRQVSETRDQIQDGAQYEEYEPDAENEMPYSQGVYDMLIDDNDFVDIDQEANDDNNDYPEIQLDDLFAIDASSDDIDVIDIDDINQNDIDGYVADYVADDIATNREPIGYDVGRSGKKYTAEELDMLIN